MSEILPKARAEELLRWIGGRGWRSFEEGIKEIAEIMEQDGGK